MFRISCFADEISPDFDKQLEFLKKNDIKFIELRSVWEKNVLDLSDKELEDIKKQLDHHGIKISSIGSPIGKFDIQDDFEVHMERFKRAVYVALKMESRYIRIFSFYNQNKDPHQYEKEVINRLKVMVEYAKNNDVILLHENEADIYGESSESCLKLFEQIKSPYFKAVFDPSNFVMAGEDVLSRSFENLKDHIEYLHLKDSVKETKEIVIVGLGDGNIPEVLGQLRHKKDMFISLEPHLAYCGQFKGFTGSELFQKDFDALKAIIQKL